MPTGQGRPDLRAIEEEDYRRRQEAKALRRKRNRRQRLILSVSLVVALALLILCFVMIIRAVVSPGEPKTPSISASISVSADPGGQKPTAQDPSAWNLILINSNNKMPDGFDTGLETDGLLVPVDNVGHLFDSRAADKLKEMVDACNAVEGQSLSIVSGYRGPQTQDAKYNDMVAEFKAQGQGDAEAESMARQIEPPFGYSDHQSALAVDFVTGGILEVTDAFAETPEAGWLRVHAAEYGFILRYPKEKEAITGVLYKPYHFRYVGVEEAKAITASGICLEEYLAQSSSSSAPPASSSAE